ncbi:UNKNOWN [Stylonychia lemnae]|uniref:Uncharacterized protein n=1 Tax=Stylonychia lemnae TaxID=5949 RepID=A0A078AZ91_STYLE|nr:UNKNOWN [Stylonychia lemnae]|eukprot:CDW87421.1 UNKNOWN [Stylonychia lemnae]
MFDHLTKQDDNQNFKSVFEEGLDDYFFKQNQVELNQFSQSLSSALTEVRSTSFQNQDDQIFNVDHYLRKDIDDHTNQASLDIDQMLLGYKDTTKGSSVNSGSTSDCSSLQYQSFLLKSPAIQNPEENLENIKSWQSYQNNEDTQFQNASYDLTPSTSNEQYDGPYNEQEGRKMDAQLKEDSQELYAQSTKINNKALLKHSIKLVNQQRKQKSKLREDAHIKAALRQIRKHFLNQFKTYTQFISKKKRNNNPDLIISDLRKFILNNFIVQNGIVFADQQGMANT